ncbi:uncharacterized protein B0J16DRAFT_401879 [Fusarium flagelliforme]|uniref:Uncharacterized protein n=1 Tax=Fusarium flagelliforme TaxID=2675880 RepID=A0A395MBZ7_9HYPO|nr:uncharacterized protein B0J16DRAFT_401879 [Fusarium flagelliforme]KAH7183483.1 hypothetical protein B0J16DRAFT_401879 [Fusarium flagelliforme]RFN45346.1 hypothetical protein FIE12Z_10411 [Fusarium flagelliforme]
MSSSHNDPWLSARIQKIEDTLKDIADYKVEAFKLENLLHEHRDLRRRHPIITKDAEDQLTQTLDTIKKVESLIEKAGSRKAFTPWVERIMSSGLQSEEFDKLKQEMAINNGKVKSQAGSLERIARSQPTDESGQLAYDLFNPRTVQRIPFTDPYDEELCDF